MDVRGWEVRTASLVVRVLSRGSLVLVVSVWRERLEGMRGRRDGPAIGDARIGAFNALQIGPIA
jgi:hypothetical protein